MEEFLANLNTVIEEREDKLAKRKELIKDLNDFSKLYEELKGVILELENKYNLSQSEEDKKELEEYLKEKILYQNTNAILLPYIPRIQSLKLKSAFL